MWSTWTQTLLSRSRGPRFLHGEAIPETDAGARLKWPGSGELTKTVTDFVPSKDERA